MFENLQRKWKVNGIQVLLILTTFALGGSICGIVGRKIMGLTGIDKGVIWIITYIFILTIIWPLCVLLTSIPLGQFTFFKKYISKIFNRFKGKDPGNKLHIATPTPEETFMSVSPEKRIDSFNNITRLAIFASGAVSNAKKIIGHFENNPSVKIVLIVCNKPGVGVLQIAKAHHIETLIIERERFFNGDGYCPVLKQHDVSLIILAGFLWKIPSTLLKGWPASII
ncbi:MAG TPA: formyltransferase family protein, partial [Ferruginibacter sp.]|nr:formyltransferase family protein [Ferruginibacter sp.]